MKIELASANHIPVICKIDSLVIGSSSRENLLEAAVTKKQCIIALENNETVGFALFDTSFFGYSYIPLVIVSPLARRKGAASALIHYIEQNCKTQKLFTSTNESNTAMQRVCESLGFVRSGMIENLDEGDPEWIYFKPIHTP